uniref:Uncharacterized protein n=1 Tax=Rhizophora mucronata TaxID=61149 RepID=A0A2P2NDF5_RHIMU
MTSRSLCGLWRSPCKLYVFMIYFYSFQENGGKDKKEALLDLILGDNFDSRAAFCASREGIKMEM